VRQFLWLALLSTPTRYGGPSLWRTRTQQVAKLSQRDRAADWVSFGQKCKTGTGIRYFANI